jgi:hypothetical protein
VRGIGLRVEIALAGVLVVATGAHALQVTRQAGGDAFHVSPRNSERCKPTVEKHGRIRSEIDQMLDVAWGHPKLRGQPLKLRRIHSRKLATLAPSLPQPIDKPLQVGQMQIDA